MRNILVFASGGLRLCHWPLDRNKLLFFMKINFLSTLLLFLSIGMVWSNSYSQNIRTKQIAFEIRATSLKTALSALEKESGLTVFYPTELVDNQQVVHVPYGRRTIAATLDALLASTNLSYTQTGQNIVLFEKELATSSLLQTQDLRGGIVYDENRRPIAGVSITMKNWKTLHDQFGIQTSTATDGQ